MRENFSGKSHSSPYQLAVASNFSTYYLNTDIVSSLLAVSYCTIQSSDKQARPLEYHLCMNKCI